MNYFDNNAINRILMVRLNLLKNLIEPLLFELVIDNRKYTNSIAGFDIQEKQDIDLLINNDDDKSTINDININEILLYYSQYIKIRDKYKDVNFETYLHYTSVIKTGENDTPTDMSFDEYIANKSATDAVTNDSSKAQVTGGKRGEVIAKLGLSEQSSLEDCKAYIESIKVMCRNKDGSDIERTVNIHKYLVDEVKEIFEEIYKSGFKDYSIGSFCYRPINNPSKPGSTVLSMHSFGCAIDINSKENPFVRNGKPLDQGDTDLMFRTYNSPVVKAFMNHGWGWGGRYGDYMHFSKANGA